MSGKKSMGAEVKKAVVRAARYGFTVPEMAVHFAMHKDRLTHKQYLAFCHWVNGNEEFYYWLRGRLCPRYKEAV